MVRNSFISLYIPPGKDLDIVLNMLRDEYGTSSNIKDPITRNEVINSILHIVRILSFDMKKEEHKGEGVAIFSRFDSEKDNYDCNGLECKVIWSIKIKIYLFRIDSRFHMEHLEK